MTDSAQLMYEPFRSLGAISAHQAEHILSLELPEIPRIPKYDQAERSS